MAESAELLALLKLDLLITSTAYDSFLMQQIGGAKLMISREGVTLPQEEAAYTAEDKQLVLGYAAYLFRLRSDQDTEFPRWLRWALNNRIFAEKTGGDSNV